MTGYKKRALVLVLVMSLILPVGVARAQPRDVAGHWAEEQILEWLEQGWVEGGEEGQFNPDAGISRGEFIAHINWQFEFFDITPVNFPDLPEDHQYWEDIAAAVAAGYLTGYTDGTVRPDKPISRLEAAVILARIAGLPPAEDPAVLAGFTDAKDIPAWGRGYVSAVVAAGLMQGYEDGSFRPQGQLTRAEASVLFGKTPDIKAKYLTRSGGLGLAPVDADSGARNRIVLYYFLGEAFSDGTVTFHLPPELAA